MIYALQAPSAGFQIVSGRGTIYIADRTGVITGINEQDLDDVSRFGCFPLGFLGRLLAADMNSTADQAFQMLTSMPFRISGITATNASISLDTAVGGIYPAPLQAGTPIVDGGQLYSDLSSPNFVFDLTLSAGQGAIVRPAGFIPILSLTTAQGAAANCDFLLRGDVYASAGF